MGAASTGLLILDLLAAPPAMAQHPNHAQGFRPEHVFDVGGIENINLFNGNLTLVIPIGPSFPVGPELSYAFTLTYAGNPWIWDEAEDSFGEDFLQSRLRDSGNAGIGWELGFGRLLEPQTVENPDASAQYQGPDQALHPVIGALHPGVEVGRSHDGTYLRFQNDTRILEHPDGTRRSFGPDGPTRIEDPFGNFIAIAYEDRNAFGQPKLWRVSDSHAREHLVRFERKRGRMVVTRVELESFDGTPATYTFSYTEVDQLPRACNGEPQAGCEDGECGTMNNVGVPLLTRVQLPDLSAFSMPLSYYETGILESCPSQRRRINGLLERLDLPTGGSFEWDWEVFLFPEESARLAGHPPVLPLGGIFRSSVGVAERRHLNRSGGVLGSWSYERQVTNFGDGLRRELVVTETVVPFEHVTKNYFSVWPGKATPTDPVPDGGWTEHEYGLPFTREVDDGTSPPRFLSQEVFDGGDELLRSVYVRYERDAELSPSNPRVASQRTVYHDDGGRRADVDRSNFDGLGHYRQEVETGNFPGAQTRTSFTHWNPGRSLSNLPGPTEPWVLDLFDYREVSQGGQTIRQDFAFDAATGFLRRTRTRASTAGACGGADVVVDRTQISGFPRLESVYGGDGQSLGCGDLATLSLPASPVYRRRHTYACGVLATTEILNPGGSNPSLFPVDRTIDCESGLVASSRDIAGLQTSYDYDDLGRLTEEDLPAGEGADTTYQYDREGTSGNQPARITVRRRNGAVVLAEEQIRFDGFGRIEEERRTMPDGTTALRKTLWSARSYVENRSEWEPFGDPQPSHTLFRQQDPFGRPTRITLPDGRLITVSYAGDGSRTIRVPVATGLVAGEPTFSNASTTEVYDRFGRLVELFEPNGTKTAYQYDAQGNLTQVQVNAASSPVQTRSFVYDGRGFLKEEHHPELGTSILYSDFDPMGNPGRVRRGGWDLVYSYDVAGRLTEIKQRGTTRVWKSWDYATGNFQTGQWSKGKLRSASRHNRIFLPGTATEIDLPVQETYTYDGVGGRISSVGTRVLGLGNPDPPESSQPLFTYSLAYDPLGNVSSRSQPRCNFNHCASSAANPQRTVTASYTQGLLAAVPGYASAVTYHPNGLFAQVTHANGVTEIQEKDPDDMARPLRLRTSGASENFDTGGYAYDGAGNVTKMGSDRYVYDLLSRIGQAQIEVPATGCGEELVLDSGTDSGTVTHQSCGTVRAEGSYRVGATGDVTLQAGQRVILGDGFSVASGGRLTAGTDPALDPIGEPTEVAQSYTYDRFGNLLSVTTQPEGETPETRTIGTNSSTNRLTVATYDPSGNVTFWAGREYRYDPFNMLWQTRPTGGNGVSFLYGPGDERLWTIDWTAGSAPANWRETWTLRGLDGAPLRQFRSDGGNLSGNWSFHRDYVYRGGALLAAHTPEGLHHFHLDHLGSPRIITDSNGTTLAQHLYFPFGEEATSSTQDEEALKFTGHERDDLDPGVDFLFDLDYMHARYFSVNLGRFQSFDPVGGNPSEPQSWNRYSYVLGNPIKYTDPEGLWPSYFPLGDFPIATFEEQITTTATGIPLAYFGFLQFGSFLRNLGLMTQMRRAGELTNFFNRPEVKQFAACVERRGAHGRAIHLEGAGFWIRLPNGRETGVFPNVVDFGRTPEGRTFTTINLPTGALANFHNHSSGGGGFRPGPADLRLGSRMPVFILHKPTGVRAYEAGLSEDGVPVAPAGWYRGLASESICRQSQ